jgi:hypothetical protein
MEETAKALPILSACSIRRFRWSRTTLASSTTPQSQTQLSHPATVPRLRIGLAMSEGRWARHRDLATRRWDLFCWSSKSSLDTPWKWPS